MTKLKKLSNKINSLEQEKEGYKAQISELEKRLKKRKRDGDDDDGQRQIGSTDKEKRLEEEVRELKQKLKQGVKDKSGLKVKMLTENLQNMTKNLDNQRRKNCQLQRKLQALQKALSGGSKVQSESTSTNASKTLMQWLFGYFKAYSQLIHQFDISQKTDYLLLHQMVTNQMERFGSFEANETIDDINHQAITKMKELKKSKETGERIQVLMMEKLRSQNIFLKMMLGDKQIEELIKQIRLMEERGKYISLSELQTLAFRHYQSEQKQVVFQDNTRLSESMLKSIFIFIEQIIKVFDGNFPCIRMLTELQQHLRTGITSTSAQLQVTLLLERIKDWIINKIKHFRKRISKILAPQGILQPITEEQDQDKNSLIPGTHQNIEEISELESRIRIIQKKNRKLADAMEAYHAKQQLLNQREKKNKVILESLQKLIKGTFNSREIEEQLGEYELQSLKAIQQRIK